MSKILIMLAFIVSSSVLFYLLLKLSERKLETAMFQSYMFGALILYAWLLVWSTRPDTPSVQQVDSLNVRQVQKEWFMIGWQKGFDRGYQAAVDSMEVSRESY